ncbi:cyclin-dependent kinase complex component [Cordyceps militaris]|uniref:Cyclin-dependent kinase complex component n=1 Tax=Cordyceps militaris TaxID=73501 RepID=A0A2H4SJ84_CORMI|nr:cyclin-dependent kinase complex component [Cordyceps militaris]
MHWSNPGSAANQPLSLQLSTGKFTTSSSTGRKVSTGKEFSHCHLHQPEDTNAGEQHTSAPRPLLVHRDRKKITHTHTPLVFLHDDEMAAVIGDFVTDLSRFHTMITSSSSLQRKSPRSHEPPHYQQSPGRARQRSTSSSAAAAAAPHHSPSSRLTSSSSARRDSDSLHRASRASASPATAARTTQFSPSSRPRPARFPSPPPSSSPAAAIQPPPPADDQHLASMEAIKRDDVSATQFHPSALAADPRQQPSPPSDDYRIEASSAGPAAAQRSAGPLAPPLGAPTAQTIVHVRDLAHITILVQEGSLGTASAGPTGLTQYEISAMPINDVIDMVAALLTKITTANDLQHDAMQRNVTHQQQANQNHDSSGSHMSSLSHSVLAFHGKNVPAISILSYLGRIHKYCPTTYEVFLSLLVYFDRMTERVNDRVQTECARQTAASQSQPYPAHSRSASRQVDTTMRDSTTLTVDNSDETDSDLADDDDPDDAMVNSPTARQAGSKPFAADHPLASPATYFVVDSFNIHRLIISGVTCASKFFSDVFYTNSRYAKVGGLPLAELNHLELQFLILNDFRLAIPVEELEGYATTLVEFYAREVVAKGVGIK